MVTQTEIVEIDVENESALSWKAIFAGATAAAALTLLLVAFGVGVGFTVISPWEGEGLSAAAFTISAGIYMIVVAMLASTVGGYIAGRLRTRWHTVHEHERFFRDSAHGFLVWALATVLSAGVLGGAVTHVTAGLSAGVGPASVQAADAAPSDIYVDDLLRRDPGQTDGETNLADTRSELGRLLTPALGKRGEIDEADRTYMAQVVANRTGLSQEEASARVEQVIAEAKAAADAARKAAAAFALWLAASMLAGALAGSLAAIEGGKLRNREWWLTE